MKKHIPNAITLLNLLSGIIAVFCAAYGVLDGAALFVVLGILFDFFDGFAARLLGVQGELGKQLDSLADMVTSGLVPGIVLFQLLLKAIDPAMDIATIFNGDSFVWIPFLGFLVTLSSAYRLANFNIDTRQSSSFIGLPTPANALLILSIPLIVQYSEQAVFVNAFQNIYVLLFVTVLSTYLLNAPIPLFALKFKNYSWKENGFRYVFLGSSFLMIVFLGYISIPIIILFYVLLSVLQYKK